MNKRTFKIGLVLPRSNEEVETVALPGTKSRSGFFFVKDPESRIHLAPVAYFAATLKAGIVRAPATMKTVATHEATCEHCGRIIVADFAVLKASGVPREKGKRTKLEEISNPRCPDCMGALKNFGEHVYKDTVIGDSLRNYLEDLWKEQDENPSSMRLPSLYGAIHRMVDQDEYTSRSILFRELLRRTQRFESNGVSYPLFPQEVDAFQETERMLNLWLLAPEVSVGTTDFQGLLGYRECGTNKFRQSYSIRLPKPTYPKFGEMLNIVF